MIFAPHLRKKYNCSPELIKSINYGYEYHQPNIEYPIRGSQQMRLIRSKQGWFSNKNNPSRKLTDSQVYVIINLLMFSDLTFKEIANKQKVSVDQVQKINRGLIWKHIIRPIPCRKKTNNLKVLQVATLLQTTKKTYKEIMDITGYKDRHTIQRINQHLIYQDLLKDYPNPIR